MAEDAEYDENLTENEIEQDPTNGEINTQSTVHHRETTTRRPKKKECNSRIEELAKPSKRFVLALWQEHSHHFPKERNDNIKQLLEELYALTPEEVEDYFAQRRLEAKKNLLYRKTKAKFHKVWMVHQKRKQRKAAYEWFRKMLKRGFSYAVKHSVPELLSIRLRYLSDQILEQLCDLMCEEVPNRDNLDKMGIFLISCADWLAIAVEKIHYELTINKDDMYGATIDFDSELEMKNLKVPEENMQMEEITSPIAQSTPYLDNI